MALLNSRPTKSIVLAKKTNNSEAASGKPAPPQLPLPPSRRSPPNPPNELPTNTTTPADPSAVTTQPDVMEDTTMNEVTPNPPAATHQEQPQATATQIVDAPDSDINQHITNLNVSETSTSSAKKKAKKSVTEPRKSSKATPKTPTPSNLNNPPSILKGSRSTSTPTPHDHVFKRVIIEAALYLDQEQEKERYAEFKHAIGVIQSNAVMVDPTTVIEPMHILTKLPPWNAPKHLPSNMTELGKFIFIGTTPWRFKDKGTKQSDNVVFFSFTMSSDTPLAEMCAAINMEWGRQNGEQIAVKTVQTHDTVTPVAIFFLWNDWPADLFLPELQEILTECWKYGLARNVVSETEWLRFA